RTSPKYVNLARGLSESQKEIVEGWGFPGIILEAEFARRYNYGRTLSHVLGHVDAYGEGIAGLEVKYNDVLHGVDGRRAVKRDRRGQIKSYVGGSVVEPRDGETLVLTIDLIRQTIVEEELEKGIIESGANWGTAIAMNPYSGAVLAMANYPTYDPNVPGRFPTAARRNHAITDRIEPGSTFKLVAAAAALERGLVSLDDTIDTGNGFRMFGRRPLHDTHGYGRISFEEVIAYSSNIGVGESVRDLKPGDLYQYARNLGFGQPTWIDLPGEVSGSLKKPRDWSGTSKTSISIGYEVDVTPLQMLTAYCALANGGLLVRPYVVKERRNYKGETTWTARQDSIRRAFKKKTARKLIHSFERVVDEGTGTRAAIAGVRVAGKTGTARKAVDGGYSRKARATFVGFFPVDDPQVALIVVLDEPSSSIYGGQTAAPIFQRIGERWISTFPDLAKQRAVTLAGTTDDADVLQLPSVPNVSGQPAAVAATGLLANGFHVDVPDIVGATRRVLEQRPKAGRNADHGSFIRLAVATSTDTVRATPDVRGLSVRQATFWLAREGANVTVEGHGRVMSQTPRPGEPLTKNTILKCQ
ncbi:MAG: penicillin-binding transpeptidase domain-containing protein, partial [Rhodothermales bacterium]|nr:penicillin-binding transpeptidase domain-containing protein [Rhodothermales bacterium]